MPSFDVHSYIPVRVKVTGVEAESHEAAIAAVENDDALQGDIARKIEFFREGDRIEAVERDEGALAVGYLVDVRGDEEYSNSRSFDVDLRGRMTEVGQEPGARVTVSALHRAALGSYERGTLLDLIDHATDQRNLQRSIEEDHENTTGALIGRLLLGLSNEDRASALGRLERAIDNLTRARDAIEASPAVTSRLNAVAFHTAGESSIPVFINDKEVGQIVRPSIGRQPGLWRNARFCVEHTVLASGLPAVMDYFRKSYAVDLHLEIELFEGYIAIYGPDGTPKSRVLQIGSTYYKRRFEPHESEAFTVRGQALDAARR